MVILVMGMSPQVVLSKPYLEGIPSFRQHLVDFTSDVIHYSQNGLTRNLDRCFSTNEDTVIDRFIGDRVWRDVYKKALSKKETIGIHRALIDYYKARLSKLGYVVINDQQQTVREPLIRSSERNAPLYRLIFASKHPLGNKIWNEVTKKNYYGQQNLL